MEKVEDTKVIEDVINKEEKPKHDTSHINKEYNTSTIISKTVLDFKKQKEIPITFGPINRNNYNQLKQLNNMTLPVRYLDGFYLRIIHNLRFGRFAYFNDIIVGSISWKYDDCDGVKSVYLMTISVLDEYRRYGIGSKLLKEVIRIHKNVKELACINLHVQISNKVALKFYERHNFESVKLLENYYTGVEVNPKDAYYLRFNLHEENNNIKEEIKTTA
jgi:ribosomal protein S18 acetylase RimI-like enzyme